jgi:predicted phage terminase large subunit-like protein
MPPSSKKKLSEDAYTKKIALLEEKKRLRAIDHHLDFINYVWQNPADPFVIGRHTRIICDALDKAINKYRKGQSSFLVIMVPFRHGKSEIISRKLPAHYLGLFPEGKVLLAGHTAELTVGFSKESRQIIGTSQYRRLFPDVSVNPNDSAAGHWRIFDHQGECFACGLGGSMAGQGYTLGLLDDYCRNRLDAESATIRQRMWDSFTNDFMTRRAPVSITAVVATPWHIDDIIGRIKKRITSDNTFPHFEIISIPAFSEDYKDGILFPERFNKEWYNEQRSTLGEYGTASLMQLNPVARGGNMFKVENIVRHKSLSEYPTNIQYWRVWDLAHTAKERVKDDPDYTSGTLLGYRRKPGQLKSWELWIKDVRRERLAAPQRDKMIQDLTNADGPYVKVGIEDTMDSKDSFLMLQDILRGQRHVVSARGRGDKVVRATPLEPIFEAGNVHVLDNAPWLNPWVDEIAAFPSGKHDDQVDNLSAGYLLCARTPGVVETGLMEY